MFSVSQIETPQYRSMSPRKVIGMPLGTNPRRVNSHREQGFSLLELVLVLVVIMVVSAMAAPQLMNAINMYKLRNAASTFAGIAQQSRSRAVQDSTFYSVYFNTSDPHMTESFIDLKKNATLDTKDPIVQWGPEIQPVTVGSVSNTGALKTAFMASSGSSATVYDGSVTASPITFSAMGIPCAASSNVCLSSNPVAYWVFLKDSRNSQIEAITVTPAGKIQKWITDGNSWSLM